MPNVASGRASVVGTKYGTLNQDVSLLKRIPVPNHNGTQEDKYIIIAAVLDGHGMLGEVAADAAGKVLLAHVEECVREHVLSKRQTTLKEWGKRHMREMFDVAFQKAHACVLEMYKAAPPKYSFPDGTGLGNHVFELHAANNNNASIYTHPEAGMRLLEFGTTASLVVIEPGFVAVGHVGDSDVVLGSLDGQFLVATELTRPHSGHNLSERYRIGEFLCDDEELLGLAALREDGYLEVNKLGGLSSVALGMTRAVGHYHLQGFGVIPSPEISFYDIDDAKDVCVILATDGIWDAMHPRDAVLFVCKAIAAEKERAFLPDCVSKIATDLCNACVDMQIKAVGGADNTSAAVVFLSVESFIDRVMSDAVSDVHPSSPQAVQTSYII